MTYDPSPPDNRDDSTPRTILPIVCVLAIAVCAMTLGAEPTEEAVDFWGGEMGRLPVVQNEKNIGRDHDTYEFSVWLADGGFRAGHVHDATDEVGHHAVENVVTHADYHATLLHLFGLDHRRLSFPRPGGTASLVDGQTARIVNELLA